MRRGMLSDLFVGVVVKRLTLVEADSTRSNQHEFQGTEPLRRLLGLEDRRRIPTRFIWLSGEQEALTEDGFMSWSDVRKKNPKRTEYHLYYSNNAVTEIMQPGDMIFIALQRDNSLILISSPSITMQNRIRWLFGIGDLLYNEFVFKDISKSPDAELDFSARYILDELGIDINDHESYIIDSLIDGFGSKLPSTRKLSELARTSLADVSAADDPDHALLMWMEQEERLFRRLERRIVAAKIESGFRADDGADVDGFIAFSLSVQNRRKARAGLALENHLEAIFQAHGLRYARGVETENRNKPDFLFPGQADYRDPAFPCERLVMLGAKSSLKDRWRQVLSEAARIPEKHLLTLEPGISENQTDEMQAKNLRLVTPRALHATFNSRQQEWLMNVAGFIDVVGKRQGA